MFPPSSLGDFPPLKYIEYLSRGARYLTGPSQPSCANSACPRAVHTFFGGACA